ncbi:MAG: hypothetical protein ABI120_13220, partial [Gemmatimonadaceae bacterium]
RTARRVVDAREDHVPRFIWLLLPALILLLFDSLRAERGSRAVSRKAKKEKDNAAVRTVKAAQVIALMAMIAPFTIISCAKHPDAAALIADKNVQGAIAVLKKQFAEGDSSASTRYNLGSALLAADSLAPAAELLEGVRKEADGEVRMRSRFNAGLAELKQGRDPNNPSSGPQLGAALAAYKSYLAERPADIDAKWNYELALRTPPPPSGGGGGSNDPKPESPDEAKPKPSPGALDQKQAEALLNSAAREERDVQGKKQKQGRTPPPGGKDW